MNCYGGHFSVQNNLNLGKINGTKYGTLISKYEGKLWDIDIKNMAVSLTRNIACIR